MTDTSTFPSAPAPGNPDADLVRAYLGGDRAALGGIYDRYASGLYDTAAAMLSDRHEAADVVQDVFLIACERLGQLREPDRLKPWLYSIARHEIYRRTKKRSRNVLTSFDPGEGPEMAAPADPMGAGEQIEYLEMAELVRSAANGLDERDQLVLELSLRQGLQGADLAAALGISADQSYTLVHRMRERVEKSLGALVVARAGRKDCAALADVLKGWDGSFSVLVRKRVARHVETCQTCDRTRRKAAPFALFSAAPAMALPIGLRDRILSIAGTPGAAPKRSYRWSEDGGFPKGATTARRLALFLLGGTAAIMLGVLGGAALSRLGDTDRVVVTQNSTAPAPVETPAPTAPVVVTEPAAPVETPTSATASTPATSTLPATTIASTPVTAPSTPSTPPPTAPPTTPRTSPPTTPRTKPHAPGELSLSATVVNFGADGSTSTVVVTNVGASSVKVGVDGESPIFGVDFNGASLAPGESAGIPVRFFREDAAIEGDFAATFTITGPNPQPLTLKARVEVPPSVDIVSLSPQALDDCQGVATIYLQVAVGDDSLPLSVVAVVTRKGQRVARVELQEDGDWYGTIDLQPADVGTYSVKVTATDARGNSNSAAARFSISNCIG